MSGRRMSSVLALYCACEQFFLLASLLAIVLAAVSMAVAARVTSQTSL